MGDVKRTVGFAIGLIAIGLSLVLPWWEISAGDASISIGLREIELCGAGTCHELEPGGAYGFISTLTFFCGLAALLGLFFGGLLPAIGNAPTKPAAYLGATLYLALVGLTIWTLPEEITLYLGADRTIGYACAVGGPVAALAGAIASAASEGRRGMGGPRTPYRPPEIVAPPPEPAPVPFALARVEIREGGLVAVGADGARRELGWDELGGGLARDLPGDTLLVDLVPRAAAPLRFTATTALSFATGELGAADPRDRLRRLLTVARAMNPELELEPATAEFVAAGAPLPPWSLDDLTTYDERYRRFR